MQAMPKNFNQWPLAARLRRSSLVASLLAASGMLSSCGDSFVTGIKKADDDRKSENDDPSGDGSTAENEMPDFGDSPEDGAPITPQGVKPCSAADGVSQCFTIKNAFELRATLSTLTQISYQEPSIAAVFEEVRGALPMENKVTLINETVANAIYKLSEVYCARMMENANEAARVLPTGVTLVGTAASVFGPSVDPQGDRQRQTIQSLLNEFWGLEIDTGTPARRQNRELAESEMSKLFVKLLAPPQPQGRETANALNANLTSLNVMKALCIPALAAAPVILK